MGRCTVDRDGCHQKKDWDNAYLVILCFSSIAVCMHFDPNHLLGPKSTFSYGAFCFFILLLHQHLYLSILAPIILFIASCCVLHCQVFWTNLFIFSKGPSSFLSLHTLPIILQSAPTHCQKFSKHLKSRNISQ